MRRLVGRVRAHRDFCPIGRRPIEARGEDRGTGEATVQMTFKVEFTPEAEADLDRLFDLLLERAETVAEAMRAYDAIEVIRTVADSHLSTTPYSYRKVGQRLTLRELIVPFDSTGYVLRFDIRTPELVLVIGARPQRQEDYQ